MGLAYILQNTSWQRHNTTYNPIGDEIWNGSVPLLVVEGILIGAVHKTYILFQEAIINKNCRDYGTYMYFLLALLSTFSAQTIISNQLPILLLQCEPNTVYVASDRKDREAFGA